MAWRLKKQSLVTAAEVAMAKSLLPPNPEWKIGVIQTNGHIQFRGAMHPDADMSGNHPGVEVWTDIVGDQHGAIPMAEDFGTSTPDEIETVLAAVEATGKGYPRDEVYSVIMIESGWKPHNYFHSPKVKPENAAGGLIGFMPFVLKSLGWTGTAIEFRAQSTAEQAPWVAEYFARTGGWKYPGDTYVATAAAGYVGRAPDVVVYTDNPNKENDAWDLNKVWDIDKDKRITVGELRQVLLTRMKKAPSGGTVIDDPKEPGAGRPGGGSLVPVYYLGLSLSPVGGLGNTHEGRFNSEIVRVLQSLLKAKGFYTGRVDGDHGPLTEAAIRKYMATL